MGSIPRLGKSPGEGKGYPLQSSGLENSMDCSVHGVTKSDFPFHQVLLFTTDFILILFFKKIFGPCFSACGILVPLPGIELSPPAVEARSLNHWTVREVPVTDFMEGRSRKGLQRNIRTTHGEPQTSPLWHLLSILGSAHQPAISSGPDLRPFLGACSPTSSPDPPLQFLPPLTHQKGQSRFCRASTFWSQLLVL